MDAVLIQVGVRPLEHHSTCVWMLYFDELG